jgi:hypothetical protein
MVNLSNFFGSAFNIASLIESRILLPFVHRLQAAVRHTIMFVYRKESLPKDPVFPTNLKQLGYALLESSTSHATWTWAYLLCTRYFVNDEDQIRMIADPQLRFLFKISSNDRYNEMQREAMDSKRPFFLFFKYVPPFYT